MNILNQFGFDWRLFVAQIVNFLIIAYIFKRYLYKPLFSVIKKRDEIIKKGVTDAQKAEETLEQAQKQKDEIIKEAAIEGEQILEEARKQGQAVRDESVVKAKEDAEKIIQKANEQISLERENLEADMRKIALVTTQNILEKVIKELFDKKDQDVLIKKGLEKIKNT